MPTKKESTKPRKSKKSESTRYVAFLRGINVGGHKSIGKDLLIQAFTDAGFTDVRTYIQSGNVLFSGPEMKQESLTRRIEQALEDTTGFKVEVMVRTMAEIEALVESDPFGEAKEADKTYTYVAFLNRAPEQAAREVFLKRRKPTDRMEIHDTQTIHLVVKEPGERTAVDFIEKDLGVRATVRNWNTVKKIAAL